MSAKETEEYCYYQIPLDSFSFNLHPLFLLKNIAIMGGDTTDLFVKFPEKIESEFCDLMKIRDISVKKMEKKEISGSYPQKVREIITSASSFVRGFYADKSKLIDKLTKFILHGETTSFVETMKEYDSIDVLYILCGSNPANTLIHKAAETPCALQILRIMVLGLKVDTTVRNTHKQTPFIYAIENGNIEAVKFFLKHYTKGGKTLDFTNFMPMITAARNNRPEIAKLLMQYGYPAHILDNDGNSPFYIAITSACEPLALALLEAGIDPLLCPRLYNLLTVAVRNRVFNVVKKLLEMGVTQGLEEAIVTAVEMKEVGVALLLLEQENIQLDPKLLLLHKAILLNSPKLMQGLILAGAGLNVRDKSGTTPLHRATIHSNISFFDTLMALPECDKNCRDDSKRSPLYYACCTLNCGYKVEKLLEAGCDTKTSEADYPLLHLAILRECTELAYLLLKAGCDPEELLNKEKTALHAAVMRKDLKMVYILIEAGANINAVTPNNWTPLNLAAEKGYVQIVEKFLLAGCDKEIPELKGFTPFHIACLNRQYGIANILMKAGCNINTPNHEMWTPLHTLIDKSAVIQDDVCDIAHAIATAKYLINAGCDINALNNNSYSPLHFAILKGSDEIAEALIEKGAILEYVDDEDRTALIMAIWKGNLRIVKKILQTGFTPDEEDPDAKNPLLYALSEMQIPIALELIRVGCNVNVVDESEENEEHNNGDSPLIIAARMGEHELVEALLKAGANANFSNKFGNTALNELQLSEGTAESIGKITALLLEASLQSHHFGVSHDGWSVAHPITDDLSAFPNPNLVAF